MDNQEPLVYNNSAVQEVEILETDKPQERIRKRRSKIEKMIDDKAELEKRIADAKEILEKAKQEQKKINKRINEFQNEQLRKKRNHNLIVLASHILSKYPSVKIEEMSETEVKHLADKLANSYHEF